MELRQAQLAGPGEVELKTLGSGKTHVLRERELCSEARKLADAGNYTVGIEDKRTSAQTQYKMFYIPNVLHTA